jgi:hypothetical protein
MFAKFKDDDPETAGITGKSLEIIFMTFILIPDYLFWA